MGDKEEPGLDCGLAARSRQPACDGSDLDGFRVGLAGWLRLLRLKPVWQKIGSGYRARPRVLPDAP